VRILAPGCAAADLMTGLKNPVIAATAKPPTNYSVVTSGAGTIGSRPAFRMETKYRGDVGDLFEASAYLETSPGAGYFVTSRGPAGQEALAKARLEAALAAFEVQPRPVKLQAPYEHAGGWELAVPEGFDLFFGPSARGLAVYSVGKMFDSQRTETVSLFVVPESAWGSQLWEETKQALIRDMKEVSSREATLGGQKTRVQVWQAEKGAQLEVAMAEARFEGSRAALMVQGAMLPPGRAAAIFEAVAGSFSRKAVKPPALSARPFGSPAIRTAPLPEGWTVTDVPDAVTAVLVEKVPKEMTGSEEGSRFVAVVEAATIEDNVGEGTPESTAEAYVKRLDPRQFKAIGDPTRVTLADGREAWKVLFVTVQTFDVLVFARASAGAIAQVHIAAAPGLAADVLPLAEPVASGLRFLRLDEQQAPGESVARASRDLLPSLIERARTRRAGESWYVGTQKGNATGGQRIQCTAEGVWTDSEAHKSGGLLIASTMKGSRDRMAEVVELTGKTKQSYETAIDASDPSWATVSRAHDGKEARTDRIAKTDLFLPPDVSCSDGVYVALAEAPEGTYAFQIVAERSLVARWKEFRVKGTEDVAGLEGTVKARLIETGARTKVWVAGGRVVRTESGETGRRLATEAEASKFLKK
jgi:hypothetical protein